MYFTNFHEDLLVDGDTYLANTAIVPSTLKQTDTITTDNLTVSGILSSVEITVKDILGGRYDFASVRFFIVDYLDLASGPFAEVSGTFGEIQAKGNSFETELRLLIQQLLQKVVEVTTRDCRVHEFADARCALNVATYTFTSSVGASPAPTRYSFMGTGTDITGKVDHYFRRGKLTWTSGDNIGIICDVKESTTGTGLLELQRELRYDVQIGDTFEVVAGCDRRFETCRDKFSNVVNYQGEPHIRGTDYMVRAVVQG